MESELNKKSREQVIYRLQERLNGSSSSSSNSIALPGSSSLTFELVRKQLSARQHKRGEKGQYQSEAQKLHQKHNKKLHRIRKILQKGRIRNEGERKWLEKTGKKIKKELTTEEKTMYRRMFSLLDADGGGTLDVDELCTALAVLGLNPSEKQIEAKLQKMFHCSEIDFDQFIQFMLNRKMEDGNEQVDWAEEIWGQNDNEDDKQSDNRGEKKDQPLPFFLWIPAYSRRKNFEVWESLEHVDNIENHISLPIAEENRSSNFTSEGKQKLPADIRTTFSLPKNRRKKRRNISLLRKK
eukprot:g566.t1